MKKFIQSLYLLVAVIVLSQMYVLAGPGGSGGGGTDLMRLWDGSGGVAITDPMTNSIVQIPYDHYKIHAGFDWERYFHTDGATANTLSVAFKTVSGSNRIHMLFGHSSNDETLFEVIEGATWTQGSGSLKEIFNIRRDKGDSLAVLENKGQATFTANNKFIKNPLLVTGGTVIHNVYTYNASLPNKETANTRGASHEWVLKPDTTYVARSSQQDGACKQSIELHHYEHTDSN